jgi:hypothetical protein
MEWTLFLFLQLDKVKNGTQRRTQRRQVLNLRPVVYPISLFYCLKILTMLLLRERESTGQLWSLLFVSLASPNVQVSL